MIDWRREPYALRESDLLIGASDGLWTLSSEEIAALLRRQVTKTAAEIAHSLLQLLKDKGKPNQDNATIGIIKAGS
jgi:serine/threonine protein phosphatase PrpC